MIVSLKVVGLETLKVDNIVALFDARLYDNFDRFVIGLYDEKKRKRIQCKI
jgi:hypothetical protein